MYDANIMKKSSRFYLKYNPDNRWSFWTAKWWSICSEISGQFTPKLGGQFDRLFHIKRLNLFIITYKKRTQMHPIAGYV